MEKILVVDDDTNILKVIKMRLEAEGYQVTTVGQAKTALDLAKEDVYDFALVDLKLNGVNGIQLMRKGAYSYLTKPFNYDELLLQTKNCLEKTKLTKEIKSLKKMVKDRYGFDDIIGRSNKMEKVLEQVAKAADSDATICIEGESGTGKELIAKTLHLASSRADRQFVAINCAAIPEMLFESELFGYEKGAFTGALQNKQGLIFQAQDTELPQEIHVVLMLNMNVS